MCMIKGNSNITGICTGGNKFKIAQSAADETLFLNGTQTCVQAVLNIRELSGSFWGCECQ